MDSTLDMLSTENTRKLLRRPAVAFFAQSRLGERQRKGLPATQAFMLSCTASCYSNMPLHSFSPAGFDQFGLFVPECLGSVISLTPTDLQRSTLTSRLLEVTDVSGCSNTPPTEKSTPANDSSREGGSGGPLLTAHSILTI